MIFTLSAAFDELTDEQWTTYLPAIENLLIAHVNGWHLFVPSRSAVRKILDLADLSARHSAVLRVQIEEKLSTLWGQVGSARRHIVCTVDGEAQAVLGPKTLHIPLRSFEELDNCLRSKLIVENSNTDGVFYVGLAKRMGGGGGTVINLALEVVHGGGDTTAERVEEATAQARPALIIVDGDKTHPACPEGQTAQSCRGKMTGMHSTQVLHVTEVRSAENYVPLSVAHLAMQGRPQSIAMVEALDRVHSAETQLGTPFATSVLAYVSPKKGIKTGDFRKGCIAFKDSVARLVAELGLAWNPPANDDNTRDTEKVCGGINEKFLELVTEKFQSDAAFQQACDKHFPGAPFFGQLKDMLEDVVAFGIAPTRVPVTLAA